MTERIINERLKENRQVFENRNIKHVGTKADIITDTINNVE
jgi:hypothetical protein